MWGFMPDARLLAVRWKARQLLAAALIAAIAVFAFWLIWAVYRSPHRDDLSVFGAYAAGVAAVAVTLILVVPGIARRSGALRPARPLDEVADLLAAAVAAQWTRAAGDRRLLGAAQIPVRWVRLARRRSASSGWTWPGCTGI
jgi:hypothetical protein